MKYVSLLALSLVLFSACKKESYLDYYIENQSSTAITVNGFDLIHSEAIDQTISVNAKESLLSWSKLGKETDYFDPVDLFGEDLLITNSAGDTLVKDYKMVLNWDPMVEDSRAVAQHQYVLLVTDADF